MSETKINTSLITSSAVSNSRYSSSPSPVTTGGPPTPGSTQSTTKKSKPFNVFTNDGSFLERFQRSKKEEEERRCKEEDMINRKKIFENRFRNRGKRVRPEAEDDQGTSFTTIATPVKGSETPAKKAKVDSGIEPPFDQAKTARASNTVKARLPKQRVRAPY